MNVSAPATSVTPVPATIDRRHDLDALRGVAMLLGLVIHGCMSFLPSLAGIWPVVDSQVDENIGLVLSSIHGFRMPLFFMISGFFTAMLWRKRGLASLLGHRFKRIFLPLVIGTFTITPAVWAVSAYVSRPLTSTEESAPVKAVETSDESKADVVSVATTVTPDEVWIEAAKGNAVIIRSWVDDGVNVDLPTRDGSTPLAGAILFGRVEVVDVLLDAGADLNATNVRGESALSMLAAPLSTTRFVANLVQVDMDGDEDTFRRNRERVAQLISERTGDESAILLNSNAESGSSNQLYPLLFQLPLLGHLWFLSFLCWLVLGFAVVVSIGSAIGIPAMPAWLTRPWVTVVWGLPLAAIFQSLMPDQGSSFGPATSAGLLPIPSVLCYYAVFFAWGTLQFDARDINPQVGRFWPVMLILGVFLLFPIGLWLAGDPGAASRTTSILCQVAYAWVVSWGMMGLFRTIASGQNKVMRYLSDSSYWLYLVHIPIIIYVQFLVRNLTMSAWIKLPAIVVAVGLISLISYQIFVRYTPIGWLLNGRRRRNRPSSEPAVIATVVNS
ncbi:MAG: acyltransferase family protein [Planctomycetota bacterium]